MSEQRADHDETTVEKVLTSSARVFANAVSDFDLDAVERSLVIFFGAATLNGDDDREDA